MSAQSKVSIRKVRLNQGGYDDMGCYWGVGQPLYQYAFLDHCNTETSDTIRADDRIHAKEIICRKYPGARFYR